MGMLVNRTAEFFRVSRNGMELSTGNILEENLVHSAFYQTLGDEFTFQQNNNLKQGKIYTGFAYQDNIECS